MRETFRLTVDGRRCRMEADPGMPLLWALRDLLGITGPKYGCGIGVCGSCTVLEGTNSIRSCQLSIGAAEGRSFTTIEGLASDASHPVQRAWLEEDTSQCGYCQGGMILEAVSLLARRPSPSDAEIDAAFYGMLCRCGSYDRIRKAVRRAAELLTD